jgi:hypothetical protein
VKENETIVMQSYYEAIYNNLDLRESAIMLNEQYLLINVDHDKMQSLKCNLYKQHKIYTKLQNILIINLYKI